MPGVASTKANAPSQFFDVTPNDAKLLEGLQWLRITGAGNLLLKSASGPTASVTIAVAAGEYVPFGAGYVMAATTATGIQAMG
jgi:hypothetical protein